MEAYNIIKKPLVTEKYAKFREAGENKYIFEVHYKSTKSDIKKAVEALFNVKVLKVRTINLLGKTRRVGMKMGKRSDWKKAYITIKEGQKIEALEA